MLAAGILVVILVLVLLARSCGGSSAESKNEEYLNQVKAALKKSSQAGVALNAILRAPRPLKSKAAVKQVKTAHDLMQQALNDASAIEPTKQAEAANPALIQALSYRVNGLQCLQQNLPQAYQAKQNVAGGKLLAPCMQRLLASDVVYADSYQARLNNDLSDAGVDVRAPSSVILPPASVNTVTPAGAGLMLQRLKPGAQGSGLHGMSLDSTVAQSGGNSVTLRPGGEVNQVKASSDLTFVVTATNGGDFQEFDIVVKVTLGEGSKAVTRTATIDQVGPEAEGDGLDQGHRDRLQQPRLRPGRQADGSGDACARRADDDQQQGRVHHRVHARPVSTADTALYVAIGAAVVAALALLLAIWLFVRLRALRRGQMVLMGGDQTDLMSYALSLLARVESVEARATEVESIVDSLGRRVDSCLQQRALIRYDALDGSGGRQSVSMALLDASGSGFVLTAIQDREYARMYVKELREGEADLELSPEERKAVDEALAS